jgi:hypothetical protein
MPVYDSGGRQVLWERLGGLISNDNEAAWCVLGDFNAIRSLEERHSCVVGDSREDFSHFNQFMMIICLLICLYVAGITPGIGEMEFR